MGLKKGVIINNGEDNRAFDSVKDCAIFLNTDSRTIIKHIKTEKPIKNYIIEYSGENINKKIRYKGDVKCPYCDATFETYNGLCKHVFKYKSHENISKEQLLTDYMYNGIRPKCECGCGKYTNISYEGGVHFTKFISGHNSKVNPVVVSEKRKRELSEYMKKMHKEKKIPYWMTGLTIDNYTEEQKKAFRTKVWGNKERNKKLSEYKINHPFTEEERERSNDKHRTEEYRNKMREQVYKMVKEKRFTMSSNYEKIFIEEVILPLNIEFETQYYLRDIAQYCDIYIPSKNLVIECDGDFWHCNPKVYKEGPICKCQRTRIERDKIKNQYLSEHNIKLIRIWESDFITNKESVINTINNCII